MHEFRIPMRWADLDQLNHVNNVVYVDYAMQAHAQLVDDHVIGAGLPVRRARVEFVRPLLLSSKPVLVRSAVGDDVVTHEICSQDGSALFCTIVLELGSPERVDDRRGAPLQIQVRRSDVGSDGSVTLAHLFELFQEIRIHAIAHLMPMRSAGRYVIGRVDVALGEPLPWRREPYPIHGHIEHIGRSSFSSVTRIDGGRYGSATATLVGFDMATQASRPLDDAEREALSAGLLA